MAASLRALLNTDGRKTRDDKGKREKARGKGRKMVKSGKREGRRGRGKGRGRGE